MYDVHPFNECICSLSTREKKREEKPFKNHRDKGKLNTVGITLSIQQKKMVPISSIFNGFNNVLKLTYDLDQIVQVLLLCDSFISTREAFELEKIKKKNIVNHIIFTVAYQSIHCTVLHCLMALDMPSKKN